MLKKLLKSLILSFGTISVPFIATSVIESSEAGKGRTAAMTGSSDISSFSQDADLINYTWQNYPTSKTINTIAPPKIYAKNILSQYSPLLKNINFKLLKLYSDKNLNVTEEGLDIPSNKKIISFYLTYPKDGFSYSSNDVYRFPGSGYATFTYDTTFNLANKSNPFADNAQIGNMKIWRMEKDEYGQQLSMSLSGYSQMNPYNGVILPLGTSVTDSLIKSLLKDQSTTSTISWDKNYDKNKKGVYTATISQNSKKIYFKIYVTGPEFNFVHEFWHKTLPYNFLIPNNVTSIQSDLADYLFERTILNPDFVIPKNVNKIGQLAFARTTLKDAFTIPDGVKKFEERTFFHTKFNKYFKIPSSVKDLSAIEIFQNADLSSTESLEIPEGVKEIGDSIFKSAHIKSLKLNSDLKKIGSNAFQEATLDNGFKIPDSVTDIGKYAFSNISKLPQGFKLNNSLENIQEGVFSGTALNDDFVMPSKLSKISDKAFAQSKLNKNFIMPNSVKEIEGEAFSDVNLNKKFRLPNNLKNYSYKIFNNSKFNGIDFDDSSLTTVQKANDLFDQYSYISDTLWKFVKSKNVALYNKYYNQKLDSLKAFNLIRNMFNKNSKYKNYFFSKSIINKFITSFYNFGTGFTIQVKHNGNIVYIKKAKWAKPSIWINATWEKYPISKRIHTIAPPKIYAKNILSQYSPLLKNINFKLLKLYNNKNLNVTEKGLEIPSNKQTISFYLTYPKDAASYNSNDVYRFPNSGYATFTYDTTFNLANKSNPFAENAQIRNMKIWRMEKDEYGQQLSMSLSGYSKMNPYNGVILPLGTSVTDSLIKSLLKDRSTTSTISWDKNYDKNKEGVYTATINQNSKKIYFKIYVTGPEFNFVHEFWHKTLPYNFLIPNNVTSIQSNLADYLFERTILNPDFVIPKNVNKIGQLAFARTTLKDAFTIPDGIKKFEERTFFHTIFNKYFQIPSSVKDLSAIEIFQNADLSSTESLEIPEGVTEIGNAIFKSAHIKNLKLNSDLKKIGPYAFQGATIDNGFIIPDSVTEIGEYAFENANLYKKFRLPNNLKNYSSNIFKNAKFEGINLDYSSLTTVAKANEKFDEISFIKETLLKYLNIDKNSKDFIDKQIFKHNSSFETFDSVKIFNLIKKIINNNQKYINYSFTQTILDSIIKGIQYKNEGLEMHVHNIKGSQSLLVKVKRTSFSDTENLDKDVRGAYEEYLKWLHDEAKGLSSKFKVAIEDYIQYQTIDGLQTSNPISPVSRRRFNQVALDSLSGGGLSFPTFTDKNISLDYSHNGIDHNGDLEIRVFITKEHAATIEAKIIFKIIGIDEAKANVDISLAKDEIEKLNSSNRVNKISIPAVPSKTIFNEKALKDLFGSSAAFPKLPSGVKLSYSHNGLNNDGTLVVNFEIEKFPGKKQTKKINLEISGIAQTGINLAKDEIKKLSNSIIANKPSIPAVPSKTIFNEKALKDLFGSSADFPKLPSGVKLSYSHNGLNNDGTLVVNFEIKKLPGKTQNVKLNISVSGFKIAKANSDIDYVKGILENNLKSWNFYSRNHIREINHKEIFDQNALSKISNGTPIFPSDTRGTKLTYSHNGLDNDGTLKVVVKIAKSSGTTKEVKLDVHVNGIADADIGTVADQIQKLTGSHVFNKTSIPAIPSGTAFDKDVLEEFLGSSAVFPKLPSGVKLSYSHNGLNKDGVLKVHVKIEKFPGKTQIATFNITANGINKAQANKDIKSIKNIISNWPTAHLNVSKGISSVSNLKFDAKELKKLTGSTSPQFVFPTNLNGVVLTYTHSGISSDGLLNVQIKIKKSPGDTETATLKVQVGGIIRLNADNDINLVKNQIQKLTGSLTVNKTSIPAVPNSKAFTKDVLKSFGGNVNQFPSDLKKTKLTYTHEGADADGDIDVRIKIEKSPGSTQTVIFKVAVKGIDKTIANRDIKIVQDQIKAWAKGTLTTNKTIIKPVSKEKSFTGNDLGDLASNLKFPNLPSGVILTYTHDGLDHDDTLQVHVNISKPKGKTVLQDFDVEISGIEAAIANRDILSVQNIIKTWTKATLTKLDLSIPAKPSPTLLNSKSLKALAPNLVFPTLPDGVSLTYTHDELNKDGNLIVDVKISKNKGKTITQDFTVDVKGIDKTIANRDILLVQNIIKTWNNKTLTTNKTIIKPVSKEKSFTGNALGDLTSNLTIPNLPSGVILTYTHNGLDHDDTLKVHVNISKPKGNTVSQDFDVEISGIEAAIANRDILSVQNIIKTWTKATLKTSKLSIPGVLKQEPFDKKALSALSPNILFPTLPDGVSLTYTHNALSKDDTLKVHIKISKAKGKTVTQDFNVEVSGIDNAILNRYIKIVHDQIKNLVNVKLITTNQTSIASVTSPKTLDRDAWKTLTTNTNYPNVPSLVNLKYTHGGINHDGTLKILVEISQSKSKAKTVTEIFNVEVSGVDKAKANADIKSAQQTIKSWGKGILTTKKAFIYKVIQKELSYPDPFIKAISASTTFPVFPKGVSITYTHSALDHDDTLIIHFKISKNKGKTITQDFTVDVKGIEAAIANRDILSVQNIIKTWTKENLKTLSLSIAAVTTPAALNKKALSALSPNLVFPTLPDGVSLTYTHNGLDHDDTLQVHVKISKTKGKSLLEDFYVEVSGIEENISNRDIKLVQNQIKSWSQKNLNTTKTSIPALTKPETFTPKGLNYLAPNILFPNVLLPTLPDGVSLTYTHDGLDHDDTLAIHFAISKTKGYSQTAIFNVAVMGIDKSIANLDIKSVENQIKDWPKGTLNTTKTSILPVSKHTYLDSKVLKSLSSNLSFSNIPKNLILTYTHDGLDHDGTLKVHVNISKAKGTTVAQDFDVEVSGIEAAIANRDILSVQNIIKTWTKATLKTSKLSIPGVLNQEPLNSKSLTALSPNLVFPTLPDGVSLTYTHDGLDHDDTLAINVKIAKAKGKTVTQVFNVEVSGIDNSKKIKVDADIAFVKKEIINIGLGHLTPLSFIKEVQYPKTFNSDVLKSFGPTLKFPKNIKGTELTYTHLALNKDGLLPIYIKISKKYGTTVTQIFQVQVSGFDKVIANHDLKSVQNQIKGWSKGVLTTTQTYVPAKPKPEPLNSKSLNELAPNLVFPTLPDGVSLTYTHEGLDHDGTLKVHVKIEKAKGETLIQDFIVRVNGIEAAKISQANIEIKLVQNQVIGWPTGVLIISKNSIPAVTTPATLNQKVLNSLAPNLVFPNLPDGVSLTYTHDGLDHDDTLTIRVKIKKSPGKTITQDFNVKVSGIDKIIANHDIKSVQNQIKGWHIGKLTTTQASIPAVTNPKILDEQSLGSLASNLKFPILPRGIVLTYTHGSLNHDDTLKVRVTISKAKGTPKTEVFQSEVSGIETATINKDIKTVQDKIKGWTKAALTIVNKTSIPAVSTPKPFDSNALSALAPNLTFPTLPKGVSLTYTHNGIDHDGILKVQVNINHSKGIKKVQGFGIKVKGINALKMVIANGNIKLVQDQIKAWSTDAIIVDHIIKNKSSATPFDKNALNSLAPHLIYPTVPKGVTLTYTHNGLDHDDTLIIYVKIEKFPGRTETQDFRVKIKGINKVVARAKADIKLVQDKIKGLSKATLTTTQTSIPAVSSPTPFDEKTLTALSPNLKFPNLPKDVTITYTHQGLVKDGTLQLQVNINHAKGLKSVDTFDLKISGINKAKEIKANKDIKSVQDQIKKWTNVSFNEKRTFIPKVSEDTPLNSKSLKSIASNLTFPNIPKGVTLTYYHKGIEKNGTLKVHVKIEKSSGKTIVQDFDVKVTGIYNPWNLSGGLDYSKTNIIIMSFLTELFFISLILLAKIIKLKKKIK